MKSCDISKRIRTKFKVVAKFSFQTHHKLAVKGIKSDFHSHTGILTDLHHLLQGIHLLAHGKNGCSCFLFVRKDTVSHFHGKVVLIHRKILSHGFHICLKSPNPLLQNFDLLRIILCNVILQPVDLTGMVCFHQFQPGHLNIQIHLFLDIRISGSKCFDLGISKCCFIHILTASYRRFTCHDLADEFLLVFNHLPRITIEGSFCHITKNRHGIISVTLSENTSLLLFNV